MGIFRGYGTGASSANATNQAESITYDPVTSGLTSETVQDAIDEVATTVDTLETSFDTRLDALEAVPPATSTAVGPALWLYGSGDHFTNNPQNESAGTGSFDNAHAHYFAFACPRVAGTCTTVKYRLGGSGLPYNTKLAIYRADGPGGRPGTRIAVNNTANFPAFNSDTVDVITTDFTYDAGEVLWIGFKIDSSVVQMRSVDRADCAVIFQDPASNVMTGEIGLSVSEAFGVALLNPANLPSPVGLTTLMSNVPLVYFQIA
jgi:hypothetical protein